MIYLLIYTPQATSRIKYSLDMIFSGILGVEIAITSSKDDFMKHEGPVLNYSHEPLGKGIWIRRDSLMTETGVKEVDVKYSVWNSLPVLFSCDPGPDLPFDPVAAGFYMLSRYEEYLDFQADELGRFPVLESVAYRNGFHEMPVVDLWAAKTGQILKEKFPELEFKKKKFSFLSSIDVDQAWAYRNKPLRRKIGGGVKSLLAGDIAGLKDRLNTLILGRKDPYDTWDIIAEAQRDIKHIFFFQIGKNSPLDKNLPGKHPAMVSLIKDIRKKAALGLHPSIRSGISMELTEEIEILESITGEKVGKSRQHYIVLKFPDTYRSLIESGINEDYSMGFHDAPGFRAGTVLPFFFYDLLNEEFSGLKIYPFQVMDACLNRTMGLSPEQAGEKIRDMMDISRQAGGMFISIWHNSSLGEQGEWKGWKRVFEEMIKTGTRYINEQGS